jgi:hypothetical protein
VLPLVFLLCLVSCGPRSQEDFRDEGETIAYSLIEELRHVHSRDDLLAKTPKLKQLFHSLVDLAIAARDFREKHPEANFLSQGSRKEETVSDQLREELNRIFLIEGGREIIEKAQEEALNRLDAFEKKQQGKKVNEITR